MVVVCKPLLAACVPCDVVHHLREKDRDYDFSVLCNIDLWYNNITGHEFRLTFVCSIAVISIPQMLSLGVSSNQTLSMGKSGGDTFPHSFTPAFFFRLVITLFSALKGKEGGDGPKRQTLKLSQPHNGLCSHSSHHGYLRPHGGHGSYSNPSCTVTKPENQPVPVSITPIQKKKYRKNQFTQ